MTDPGRAALLRYLGDCIRAQLRAELLLLQRQARTEAAKRQLLEYDRQQVPTAEEALVGARTARRRNMARRRSR